MSTKLTVIIDNAAKENLSGEWGLCILAEYKDKKILVDAGASNLFAENLSKLGFDIKDIDMAILSHAHYDHGNGMPKFFKENSKAKFFIRENTKENCYIRKFIFSKYIGLPKHVLEDFSDRIEYVTGDYKLCDGAYLIPHKTPNLDQIGKREMMYQKTKSGWVVDNFSHEQSLVLETEKGLIIINSCSHGGANNIINEVKETFPDKKVYGIIGGFHLFNKTEEEVKAFAKKVEETNIEYICTGHCTKSKAFNILKEELGKKVHALEVGLVIKF